MAELKLKTEEILSALDGIKLIYYSWMPTTDPKKVVVIHPGFGDHSLRYKNVVEAVNDGETAVFALDARGHGKSEGVRGHADNFSDYAKDLAQLIELIKKNHPEAELTLFGHSMGGAVSLDYILDGDNQKKIDKLVVSAPALRIKMTSVVRIKKFVGERLCKIFPKKVIEAGIDPNVLSHDREVVAAYSEDPDVHGKISFQMGSTFFAIGQTILDQAHRLTIPTYVFHGTGDELIMPSGSEELYSKISSENKQLDLYPNLRHECFNELESDRKKVLDNLVKWLGE